MNRLGPMRFAVTSGAVAIAAGVVLAGAAGSFGAIPLQWGLIGWLATAAVGVVGGAWLVSRHGMAGSPFLVALATCMLSRLILAGAGAVAASTRGSEAMIAYVAGLAAGFIPVQVVEMAWFQRRSALAQQAEE